MTDTIKIRETCPECKGIGRVRLCESIYHDSCKDYEHYKCSFCLGDWEELCPTCHGEGMVPIEEEWRWVPGWRGYYKVSSFGRFMKCDDRTGAQKITQGVIHKNRGYAYVKLSKNGTTETRLLHRIVAMAFINNRYMKEEVNHIDGDKTNNSACNLEWVTRDENMRHAHNTGLMAYNLTGGGKLIEVYDSKRNAISFYETIGECANATGINSQTLRDFLAGKYKKRREKHHLRIRIIATPTITREVLEGLE